MKNVVGKFVTIEGESCYEIQHFDSMQPFFISVASDSDIWLYISSNGALTAGRRNPDNALFPYYTDDKITDSAEITGSKTIINVFKNGQRYLWEPLSDRTESLYNVERFIAKATSGTKIIFKEVNHDLQLTFCYSWSSCDAYGLVRKSSLTNQSTVPVEVHMLDGLQNILPAGIDRKTQNEYSTLVDAYKRTERIAGTTLALFRMEATLVDRAEPSESLLVNTVWSTAHSQTMLLLSSAQLKNFRSGLEVQTEHDTKGVRGAYWIHTKTTLAEGEATQHYMVADVNQNAGSVAALKRLLLSGVTLETLIEENLATAKMTLMSMVATADGTQLSSDEHVTARHYANTLFNVMRGGVYSEGYTIDTADFRKHVIRFNQRIAEKHLPFLSALANTMHYFDLKKQVEQQHDSQLTRVFLEYLPLTFSRRHGDPSRPWNNFDIRIKDDKGCKLLSYQGNWRDIFQNWEALSLSFPGYLNGIIAKFLNATTVDGYNPYRITSEGIDWEVAEPDNPWSHIGYWGDHQIIYLLKLLELSAKHDPDAFHATISNGKFAFANVPYRIISYDEMVQNPKDTIHFDNLLHHTILNEEKAIGSDARLVRYESEMPILVSFTEKILVTMLAKLTNLIPGAGIWMNTQRPEWNDANNALVGTGASMVTLYYLRRYVDFMLQQYTHHSLQQYAVSSHVSELLYQTMHLLEETLPQINNGFDDVERRSFTNKMGSISSIYREQVYKRISLDETILSKNDLVRFFEVALKHIEYNIADNKRDDGMYHTYNLVRFTPHSIEIRRLSEMLEGQVAVLSSNQLSAKEVVSLLEALRHSALYRPDQQSYMLYPNKELPQFVYKNRIPADELHKIPVMTLMIQSNDSSIVHKDIEGNYHFNANFKNAGFLECALMQVAESGVYPPFGNQIKSILELYEMVFDHQSFTGRSGTFYKYEGLGSIYWHMVSKLLLAVGENIAHAVAKEEDNEVVEKLKQHYYAIKQGIGAHKQPQAYGSFPFDPYSHTPIMSGVQQPGMTGQVKEDVISRFNELGVKVECGKIHIQTTLFNQAELFQIHPQNGYPELHFTYCSVPFVYRNDGSEGIEVKYSHGAVDVSNGYVLSKDVSQLIFSRSKEIDSIVVKLKK